jgi:hypothetical protein
MITKSPRLQNDEPGDTGGTDTGTPADTAPVNTSSPVVVEPATTVEATPTSEKIDALLDNIGKDADTPPANAQQEAKAPAPIEPKPTPGPKDLDLTPPEGTDERGKGRWATLAERARQVPELERKATEYEARATQAETAIQGVRQMVERTGLDETEFTNVLEIGRLYKSGDPKDLQTAIAQLDNLRADLAIRLGVDAPGVDVLATHPDLKDKVENMMLSREDAMEIVKLRNRAAGADRMDQGQREAQQFQQTVQTAAADMDATLAQRAGTPGHDAKLQHIKAYLGDKDRLNQFVSTYRPDQWQAAILMMYDSYIPPVAQVTPSTPQPLRPGNVSGGVPMPNGKPVSSTQAVERAWGAIGL